MKLIKGSLMVLILLTSLGIVYIIPQASSYPYSKTSTQVASALAWLRANQTDNGMIGSFAVSSWAAMAIAAAEGDPNKWSKTQQSPTLIQYLKSNKASLSSCTDYSRFILSMVAADLDPKNVDGVDLVSTLESFYNNNQFGDPTLLNDDYWAVIALISAGKYKSDPKIQSAVNFIKSHQNSTNGGWSFDVAAAYGPDVDSTAAAIMALISTGEDKTSNHITKGLAYIKSKQVASGGFDGGWGTSAETDSWAIQAIVATGQNVTGPEWTHSSGKTPIDDLLTFQNPDGGFRDYTGKSNAWTTSYAISALMGKPYPIVRGVRVNIRIEGQQYTIWKGSVYVTWSNITEATPQAGRKHYYGQPTVLGALDKAATAANFTYTVDYSYGSAYVKAIKDEAASGLNGWLFRVNNHTTGSYSCDGYVLNSVSPPDPPHIDILWYYGGWGDKVLGITVDRTTINVSETITVTVTYYDETGESWLPVADATVWAGAKHSTNQSGRALIQLQSSGTYQVYANKTGYVRSDKIQVNVTGGGGSGGVDVKANIIPALALEVTPNLVDFGTLGPKMTSRTFQINLKNTGSLNGTVTVTVTDLNATSLFRDCLQLSENPPAWTVWGGYRTLIRGHDGNTPGEKIAYIRLQIPENYPAVPGPNKGKVTFWLEPS
ncbi:hypothetical protein KEJ51_05745 [Candidatus Bathyarchaeota archaeon]|nr:hypothetical protein [Candidatus Bathyarchaeota archaeon]